MAPSPVDWAAANAAASLRFNSTRHDRTDREATYYPIQWNVVPCKTQRIFCEMINRATASGQRRRKPIPPNRKQTCVRRHFLAVDTDSCWELSQMSSSLSQAPSRFVNSKARRRWSVILGDWGVVGFVYFDAVQNIVGSTRNRLHRHK